MEFRIIIADNNTDSITEHSKDNFVHSLSTLRKTKEYKDGIRKIGRALDRLSKNLPEELEPLLNDYVQCEIDFQKFLKRECFKAGVMLANLGK